jgi:hypothetical protein
MGIFSRGFSVCDVLGEAHTNLLASSPTATGAVGEATGGRNTVKRVGNATYGYIDVSSMIMKLPLDFSVV